METSDVRKRLNETIDRAKRHEAERRRRHDQASREYEVFLEEVAVPLFRQVAGALKANRYPFTVFTPSGSVRLSSDRKPDDYVELFLESSSIEPVVMIRSIRSRGGRIVETEQAIGEHPGALTDHHVLDAVLKEVEAYLGR
jgi:hypothetical protein